MRAAEEAGLDATDVAPPCAGETGHWPERETEATDDRRRDRTDAPARKQCFAPAIQCLRIQAGSNFPRAPLHDWRRRAFTADHPHS
jgi:hypothetical protein